MSSVVTEKFEMVDGDSTNRQPRWIGLALSGGGFRATLFHLGVVRYLYEAHLLPKVTLISYVSGGSILGAHFVLHWQKYTGTEKDFEAAAQSLIRFAQLDLRGRILRRWLCGTALLIPRVLRRLSFTGLPQQYYSTLFGQAELSALSASEGQPELHILATSLTTGALCKFTKDGFVFDGRPIRNTSPPLSLAVAAS